MAIIKRYPILMKNKVEQIKGKEKLNNEYSNTGVITTL